MRVNVIKTHKSFAVIDMGNKDYGWLEIMDTNYLEQEDILEGKFDLGEETVKNITRGNKIDIFLEDWGCSYKVAIEQIMKR